jgi:hypothetical protein
MIGIGEKPMNELKPEDVMRALECCHQPVYSCEDCPYFGTTKGNVACSERLAKDALALLREKDAEIERLKHQISIYHKMIDISESKFEMLDFLTKKARAEAITEFAERVKKWFCADAFYNNNYVLSVVWKIASEMKEASENG